MIIDVLVCRPDGTQTVEQREVPDNWLDMEEPVAPLPTPDEDRDAMLIDLEYRTTLLELGVTDNAV